jgi:hypothetical protein
VVEHGAGEYLVGSVSETGNSGDITWMVGKGCTNGLIDEARRIV